MSVKGVLKSDHLPKNSFKLIPTGPTWPGTELTLISIGALSGELDMAELPDRTKVTGGNQKPGDTTIKTPAHHDLEQAALEIWYREAHDPVSPFYKKVCILAVKSLTGLVTKRWELSGCWLGKFEVSEFDMKNEGDQTEIDWQLHYDSITPLPAL